MEKCVLSVCFRDILFVPQPVYEEIKDTRLHIDCTTTQLPIIPSDSSKSVYATPQLPTNPSDYFTLTSTRAFVITNHNVTRRTRGSSRSECKAMDNFVQQKLINWNLECLIERFADEQIDDDSFLLLDENTIATLIPKIGALGQDKSIEAQELNHQFQAASEPFKGLETEYRQMKYFMQSGNFIQPIEETFPGISYVQHIDSSSGAVKQISTRDTFQRIPLRPLLKKILELPGIMSKVVAWQKSTNGLLQDFCDGELCQNHALFSQEVSIPLLIYIDDVETVNPLGSKTSVHKVGFMYFAIKCLPKELLSSLSSLFLLAVYKTDDAKTYGIDKVLKPVVEDIKSLEKEGVDIKTPSFDGKVKVSICQVVGDNLALNGVLGFTESFASNYACRWCCVPKDILRVQTKEDRDILRTAESNERDLSLGSVSDTGLKQASVFNDLQFFDVSKNLAPDIMHDILEGNSTTPPHSSIAPENTQPSTAPQNTESTFRHTSSENTEPTFGHTSSENTEPTFVLQLVPDDTHDIRAVLMKAPLGPSIVESLESNTITTQQRRAMVRIIVAHLIEKYGETPSTETKKAMAISLVETFSCLRDPEGNGYEAWFSPGQRHRPSTGFLEERLRNIRKRMRRLRTPSSVAFICEKRSTVIPASTLSPERAVQLKEWLKNNTRPQDQVEQYMKETAPFRAHWIREYGSKPISEILSEFPRLMDTPGMILAFAKRDKRQMDGLNNLDNMSADLANRSGPPKGRHSLLHVGQIRIRQVPDVGRI
ncbi:unnamed protein product [Leuciscus chuanchicus]